MNHLDVVGHTSVRMDGLPFSGIRRMFEGARALEAAGKQVIHLEVGRPDFDTPMHIKRAAKEALDRGLVHYTSNYGIPELRAAISQKLERENGLRYDPHSETLVTVGLSEAVFAALYAFLNPGDEILVPVPTWLNYIHVPRSLGAVPVPIPLRAENGFQLDPAEIARRITPRSRMLVIVNPHNPTGAVLPSGLLKEVAELAARHDLLVLSDEIYERITYPGTSFVSTAAQPGLEDRTITLNGLSKCFAMDGWRLGYVAARAPIIDRLVRVHQYNTTCAPTFAQYAAAEALTGPQESVAAMVDEFRRRRDFIVQGLNKLPGVRCEPTPQGAFYAFADVRGTRFSTADQFCEHLLQEAHVAAVPGSAFGAADEGFVRFSYATSYEQISEALDRMGSWLDQNRSA